MAEAGHFGPEAFQEKTGVSRETLERLKAFDVLFLDWTSRLNLVAKSTIEDRWHRHYWDSAQLLPLLPEDAKTVMDFGSGGGFPGLLLAVLKADDGNSPQFYLIESIAKKCAFLREGVTALGLANVTVLNERIEKIRAPRKADVITARALKNLTGLLEYAHPFLHPESVCLFLKGESAEEELTAAAAHWTMEAIPHQSLTHEAAKILEIRKLTPCRA